MADDNDEGGFLCMDLGSDVESGAEAEVKVPRDYQSKIDYEKQKAEWKPIVEKGELYKEIGPQLPIQNPNKQQYQIILHAIEQLYFYRRYQEASELGLKALEGEMGEEYRAAISSYQARCQAKARDVQKKP